VTGSDANPFKQRGVQAMIRWIGGAFLLGALGLWTTGYEPFARDDKAKVSGMQRGPDGRVIWVGGLHGGK
jgi:hypothetical protein